MLSRPGRGGLLGNQREDPMKHLSAAVFAPVAVMGIGVSFMLALDQIGGVQSSVLPLVVLPAAIYAGAFVSARAFKPRPAALGQRLVLAAVIALSGIGSTYAMSRAFGAGTSLVAMVCIAVPASVVFVWLQPRGKPAPSSAAMR